MIIIKKETKWLALCYFLCLFLKLILIFYTKDPFYSSDEPKYIEWALEIKENGYTLRNQFIYPLFIFIVYSLFGWGNNVAVIISQAVIASLLPIVIYKTIYIMTKKKKVSFLGLLLCLLFPEFYFWNNFVLTEVLYILMISLTIYYLVKFYHDYNVKNLIYLSLCIFVTFKTRETVLAMIPVFILVIMYILVKKINVLYLKNKKVIYFIPIIFLLIGSMMMFGDYIPDNTEKKINVLKKFADRWDVCKDCNFVEKTMLRFYYFWIPFLDRFQPVQKVQNIMFFGFFYIFSAASYIKTNFKQKIILNVIFLCIILTGCLHAITFLDYNYRYRLPIVPLLIIVSSIGFGKVIDKIKRGRENVHKRI